MIISGFLLLKFILLKHTNFFKLGKYKFNIPIYTPGKVFLKITVKYLNNRTHIIYSQTFGAVRNRNTSDFTMLNTFENVRKIIGIRGQVGDENLIMFCEIIL